MSTSLLVSTIAVSCYPASMVNFSGSLMTNWWSFTFEAAKTPKTMSFTHLWGQLDFYTFQHQHTPFARWFSFWTTRRFMSCPNVA